MTGLILSMALAMMSPGGIVVHTPLAQSVAFIVQTLSSFACGHAWGVGAGRKQALQFVQAELPRIVREKFNPASSKRETKQ